MRRFPGYTDEITRQRAENRALSVYNSYRCQDLFGKIRSEVENRPEERIGQDIIDEFRFAVIDPEFDMAALPDPDGIYHYPHPDGRRIQVRNHPNDHEVASNNPGGSSAVIYNAMQGHSIKKPHGRPFGTYLVTSHVFYDDTYNKLRVERSMVSLHVLGKYAIVGPMVRPALKTEAKTALRSLKEARAFTKRNSGVFVPESSLELL